MLPAAGDRLGRDGDGRDRAAGVGSGGLGGAAAAAAEDPACKLGCSWRRCSARSANLMDLAAALPRPAERVDMRYQWIERLVGQPAGGVDAVMRPFAEAVLARPRPRGGTWSSPGSEPGAARHQMLVLGVRVGERALPLAWRVRETRGSIGFVEQGSCSAGRGWLPADARIVLMGDRFYGGPDLILLCRGLGWDCRLGSREDLLVSRGRRDNPGRVRRWRRAPAERYELTAREVPPVSPSSTSRVTPSPGSSP